MNTAHGLTLEPTRPRAVPAGGFFFVGVHTNAGPL